jgi:hypothetical protein
VRHRRQVLFVKPRFWVLLDELHGARTHAVDLRFQLGDVEVSSRPAAWTRATRGAAALFIRPFSTVPLRRHVVQGAEDPIGGWLSPDYGQRRPAPAVVYSATAPLPLRLLTLLFPVENAAATPPDARPLLSERGELRGVTLGSDERVEIEGPAGVLVHRRQRGRG